MESQNIATIPFPSQPHPLNWDISTLDFSGGHVSSCLTRVWTVGQTLLCRLCPLCLANHERGVCVVHVDQSIPEGSEALFSTHGLVGVPSPAPGYRLTPPGLALRGV